MGGGRGLWGPLGPNLTWGNSPYVGNSAVPLCRTRKPTRQTRITTKSRNARSASTLSATTVARLRLCAFVVAIAGLASLAAGDIEKSYEFTARLTSTVRKIQP